MPWGRYQRQYFPSPSLLRGCGMSVFALELDDLTFKIYRVPHHLFPEEIFA